MNTSSFKTAPNLSPSNNLTVPKQRAHTTTDTHRRTLSSVDTEEESRNSSAKVWAEDFYTFDFGFEGNPEEDAEEAKAAESCLLKEPPAIFRTRTSFKDEKLAHEPTRQPRSLATLLPSFRNNSKSPKNSPTKETSTREAEYDFMPTLTGDRGGVINVADKSRGGLASWFTGSSAPVPVGIPPVDDKMHSRSNSSSKEIYSTPKQLGSPPTITPTKPATTTASRFSFFSSPTSPAKTPTTVQLPADLNNDALLTLDIETALFPGGRKEDPFSPAAFKNLLMNAEGLLLKLQTAYKVRTVALHELSNEKETAAEELDEIRTRAQCFKVQIEDLAHQNCVKDERIKELERELLAERQARAAEKEAREKSIALVHEKANNKRMSDSELSIDTHLAVEDLGISSAAAEKRKWRGSANSTDNSAADEDSDAESVFSRSRSPTLTLSSFSASSANLSLAGTDISTPEILQASVARVLSPSTTHPQPLRPKPIQQRSTFQKILTNITATPTSKEKDPYNGIGLGEGGCSNCRGKDASVAWDTVTLMRAENKGLKDRVGQLESANDDALDLIYGLGFSQRVV